MTALYAYAIVPGSLDLAGAPPPPDGIDGSAVQFERLEDLAMLVSPLDERAYHPDSVTTNSSNVEWLGVRAAAHDRVLTWAIDRGPTIPLPLFSLFRDRDSVRGLLATRAPDLRHTLAELGDAQEYTVRVFRLDAELGPLLATRSSDIAGLEARARDAAPGQRYLLDRKLQEARRDAIERIGQETAEEAYAALAEIAAAVVRDPVAARAGANGQAVLNAAFLVPRARVDVFRAQVTQLIAQRGGQGFRVEFTGPWAPYHFVGRSQLESPGHHRQP